MSDNQFSNFADKTLQTISDTIEKQDLDTNYDVDLHDGILNISTRFGVYVINRHVAAKEIWLSSPVSGPYHFSFQDNKWLSKSGVDLYEVISKELGVYF
jgi:CyaY protein